MNKFTEKYNVAKWHEKVYIFYSSLSVKEIKYGIKSSHNKYFRLNDFSIEVFYTSKEGLHILLYMILYIYVIVYIDIYVLYIFMCNTYMSIYTYMYIKANRVLPKECTGHN